MALNKKTLEIIKKTYEGKSYKKMDVLVSDEPATLDFIILEIHSFESPKLSINYVLLQNNLVVTETTDFDEIIEDIKNDFTSECKQYFDVEVDWLYDTGREYQFKYLTDNKSTILTDIKNRFLNKSFNYGQTELIIAKIDFELINAYTHPRLEVTLKQITNQSISQDGLITIKSIVRGTINDYFSKTYGERCMFLFTVEGKEKDEYYHINEETIEKIGKRIQEQNSKKPISRFKKIIKILKRHVGKTIHRDSLSLRVLTGKPRLDNADITITKITLSENNVPDIFNTLKFSVTLKCSVIDSYEKIVHTKNFNKAGKDIIKLVIFDFLYDFLNLQLMELQKTDVILNLKIINRELENLNEENDSELAYLQKHFLHKMYGVDNIGGGASQDKCSFFISNLWIDAYSRENHNALHVIVSFVSNVSSGSKSILTDYLRRIVKNTIADKAYFVGIPNDSIIIHFSDYRSDVDEFKNEYEKSKSEPLNEDFKKYIIK